MRGLNRLVDEPKPNDADRSPDLASYVDAAATARTGLSSDARQRIELELAAVAARDAEGWRRFWPVLRVPLMASSALALALALVVVTRPAPVASIAPPLPAPPLAPGPLRLDTGTLRVVAEATPVRVATPNAEVDVAPRSTVRITVEGSAVRIVADSGSARVLYYDGRVELFPPPQAPPPVEPIAPAPHAPPHRAHPAPQAVLPATPAPAPPRPAMDGERASFAAALARVRSAPAEALALLEAHLARFPSGPTRFDAERVRVAVLLKLDRAPEALGALDRIEGPTTELRVMRAELRADAQRCEEAIGDFGAVLSADEDRFVERALFGRAMCRQKLGQRERLAEDLERYLLVYPHGEFAERARLELRHATANR